MRIYLYILLFLLGLKFTSFAQQSSSAAGTFHEQLNAEVESGKSYTFRPSSAFTAIVIRLDEHADTKGAYLLAGKDTFSLKRDEHVGVVNGKVNSNLVSFPGKRSEITIFTGALQGEIVLHFLDGSVRENEAPAPVKRNKTEEGCAEPESIDQSQWRSGLPPPDYERSFTQVRHVIIHHSAGSNTNTNYTQVVRDIYLYHTQVNNWSDIGYNYLIAQDGTIFKGRDPGTGEQDNVQGAHFCGMNSNTMGVCLMGTYTDIAPSTSTRQSLIALLSWKFFREGLDPHAEFNFPGAGQLETLAGHRDGCSTECPGDMTYALLDDFRDQVAQQLADCNSPGLLQADFSGLPTEIEEGESVFFTDMSRGGPVSWEWSFEGGTPAVSTRRHPGEVKYYHAGIYRVSLTVSNAEETDALSREAFVQVRKKQLPRLFPNPVNKGAEVTLEIAYPERVRRIFISDVSGRIITDIERWGEQISLEIPYLDAGMYLLHIITSGEEETIRFTVI